MNDAFNQYREMYFEGGVRFWTFFLTLKILNFFAQLGIPVGFGPWLCRGDFDQENGRYDANGQLGFDPRVWVQGEDTLGLVQAHDDCDDVVADE